MLLSGATDNMSQLVTIMASLTKVGPRLNGCVCAPELPGFYEIGPPLI